MTVEGDDLTSTLPLPMPRFPPKKEKDFPFQGHKTGIF